MLTCGQSEVPQKGRRKSGEGAGGEDVGMGKGTDEGVWVRGSSTKTLRPGRQRSTRPLRHWVANNEDKPG